jgi:hypothetical protein
MTSSDNASPIEVTFEPDRRLSKNGLKRGHYRELAGLTATLREDARLMASSEIARRPGWVTAEHVTVDIVQFWCGTGQFDYEGLACVSAPVIDGMVAAGVVVDDSPRHVVGYRLWFERVAHRVDARVVVTMAPKKTGSEHGLSVQKAVKA